MKKMKKEKVVISVNQIVIEESFNNEDFPMLYEQQGFMNESEYKTLQKFSNNEVIYLVTRTLDIPAEDLDVTQVKQRIFLTDLESVVELTSIMWHISNRMSFRDISNYPERLNDIIQEYVLGENWDFNNVITHCEELRQYLKQQAQLVD
jgi:hypothetical protein